MSKIQINTHINSLYLSSLPPPPPPPPPPTSLALLTTTELLCVGVAGCPGVAHVFFSDTGALPPSDALAFASAASLFLRIISANPPPFAGGAAAAGGAADCGEGEDFLRVAP